MADYPPIVRELYQRYVGLAMTVFSRRPIGTNVFERDWDVLLLLDTCRIDALQEVAPEYEFIDEVGSLLSVGSCSPEWIAATFTEAYRDEIENTIYVSANAFSQRVLRDRQFPGETSGVIWEGKNPMWPNWSTVTDQDLLKLDNVWKYAPDPPHGHIRPKHITDRAIANAREYDPERLIVHYSHPHEPYAATADQEGRELRAYEENPVSYLKNGGDFDLVWNAYLDNLRLALDEVEVLLENIDADRVAISADHGDAFGEWGLYTHTLGLPQPYVKRVPWVVTSATDTGEYEPSLSPEGVDKDVGQHLKDLGYLEIGEQASTKDASEANVPGGKNWSGPGE